MKLTLERESFAKKVEAAISALGNSIIPVLNEAFFQIKNDRLFITTSNGEVQLTVSTPCEVEGEEVEFICDIRLLRTPVTTLKAKEVFLEVTDKMVTLFTKRTKNKYEIPVVYKPESYPLLNAEKWSSPLEINGASFAKMIKKSSILVDGNNIREGMRGIMLESTSKTVTMESVSGGGQAICHLEVIPDPDSGILFEELDRCLIPKAIANVSQQFDKAKSVKISKDQKDKSLKIHDGSSIVVIRLLEGVFPDCKVFLDSYEPSINLKVLNEDFSLSLKRSSSFSDEYATIKIQMDAAEEITIECEDLRFKRKAKETVPVSHKSEEMNFTSAVNYKQISKFLPLMEGESLFLSQIAKDKMMFMSDDSSEGFSTLWIMSSVKVND
jgi:DNA polymerase III sliding clamp (beta) subunit (PCNA family)